MTRLLRCHDCDLLHEVPEVPAGSRALCGRCGAVLLARRPETVERSIALALASLFFWLVANLFPFLTMEIGGRIEPSRLASGVGGLWADGFFELAVLVLLFAVAFPFLKIAAWLAVLVPLHLGLKPRYLAPLFRGLDLLHPWAMTEVFLLGVLVSYTKIVDMASITVGPALVGFVALIVTMIWTDLTLDTAEVWDRIAAPPESGVPATSGTLLVGCHVCGVVAALSEQHGVVHGRCARCGAGLHRRKANSASRAWALVVAALILYVPANLYPVMILVSFGEATQATILGGVQELIAAEMLPLALLVFFASITVPVLKLVGLAFLLVSVQRRSRWRTRERTVIYRIVESVGRWSMLDIFVLAILAGLVRLGNIATIEPGAGAISFAAVVVITMFGAMCFDPRLLWDAAGANDGH